MRRYLQFLLIGLILGLFTEAELKLVAGLKPSGFVIAMVAYPVLVTLSYAASGAIDRIIAATWKADILHYLTVGIGGLAIEWTMLGNGPGSNAFQLGMFAMWTTFCFGPRVLTRASTAVETGRRKFWIAFAVAGVLLTVGILIASTPSAKIVFSVVALSATNAIWSIWLLVLAWKSRRESDFAPV